APDVPGAARDAAGLWNLYLETLQTLSRPLMEASARAGDPGAADHVSGLTRFSDLSWDVLERTFGRLLQSPSIGFTRELNEKLLGAFSAWLEFKRATMDYQVALSTALSRSATTFLQELAARAGRGESIVGLRELLRLWGDTLDDVLIESFRSDEYARVQGRLVKAAMSYRIRERDAVDVLLKIGHVPTRRDIDEVSRSLYELRKEVRAVARAVPRIEHERERGTGPEPAPSGAEAAPAKPPTTRRAPAKPAAKPRGKAGS
ncbi:MAG: poly(R)-hydroxyalkanoic acid synthase subunit PhaE, partial [Actinomycetota bacterium]